MTLKLENINFSYGNGNKLFNDFSAEFGDGKISVLLGRSGAGKTTLLNIVANLQTYSGRISGADRVSYVFQEPRLLKSVTVGENLDIVLRRDIKNAKDRRIKIERFLSVAEMDGMADRFPNSLSGGEERRVSLIRAFMYPSDVLLMDEPFASLDTGLKSRLINSFLKLYKEETRTVLFVTHDVYETVCVADDVYIVKNLPVEMSKLESIKEPQENRRAFSSEFSRVQQKLLEVLL